MIIDTAHAERPLMQLRTPSDFGRAVRHRRRALGLDQAELAQSAGVSRQWIVALERGKEGVALALVLRTLRVLDLVLDARPAGQVTSEARTLERTDDPATAIDIDAIVERAREPRRRR
jgi:HTH-type transcriptional regulator/antitoxin HipB